MNALVNRDQYWADLASQFKAQVPVFSGKSLSCKGGTFTLGEQPLGTRLCAIVLDSIWLNQYFDKKWEEGKQADAPKCYAYGRSEAEMMPHESMRRHMDYFYPQTLKPSTGEVGPCSSCPKNEFGSAETGRGKACQNRDKLAIIPAGRFVQQGYGYNLEIYKDPQHFRQEEVVNFGLPVTSGKNWRTYAQQIAATVGRPPFGVITVIEAAPHPKFQTEIKFTMVDLLPEELTQIIVDRHIAVRDMMAEPFSPAKALSEINPPQNTNIVRR